MLFGHGHVYLRNICRYVYKYKWFVPGINILFEVKPLVGFCLSRICLPVGRGIYLLPVVVEKGINICTSSLSQHNTVEVRVEMASGGNLNS